MNQAHYQPPFPSSAHTICSHAGIGLNDGEPLVGPIAQSTTYCRDGVGSDPAHQYSRVSNPNVSALEHTLATLEQAAEAVCFANGLAAETALLLSLLKAGDHWICGRSVYGGTTRLGQQVLPDFGIETTFVDTTVPARVRSALRPNTKLVLIETPSNPTLEMSDITKIARIAHEAGALLAVDNTFLTSVLQQPLELGADISVYSTTKLMEGHSVALGGAVVCNCGGLADRLRFIRKCTGSILSPFNAWLTANGIKTLPVRIARQSASAREIAIALSEQEGVRRVCYPTLYTGETFDIALRQHRGAHGAVVSFELQGGASAARLFARALSSIRLVEHVGSVETLLTHPASMTHGDVPQNERLAAGVSDGLLRLSVGLEDPSAILLDLTRGLQATGVAGQSASCEEASSCV